jgi:hypothetical protein
MSDLGDDARQFAELLQRLDWESFELVRAAIGRLKRDHDGSFTASLDELYGSRFRSEIKRNHGLWNLILDPSQSGWRADTQELS